MAKRKVRTTVRRLVATQAARVFMDFRIGAQQDRPVPFQQFANGNARLEPDGRVSAIRRDGLIDLFTAGAIDADAKAAGLVYRAAYEAVHSRGKSADIPSPASGVSAPRLNITDAACDALAKLKRFDRIVGPQCVAIVRKVAGEGATIRDCYKGANSRKLAARRLRIGLGRVGRDLGRV